MTLVRRHGNWLPSVFNDLFDNDLMLRTNTGSTAPAINVKETVDGYLVEVAAPGLSKEDFNVRVDEDDNLVITLEKQEEKKDENKEVRYLRCEFSYSKFQQTMILPDNIDKDKISAKVENGVLSIDIPKLSEVDIKKAQRLIEIV
ncbi:MAG TPA: Hsp20/alpha crystallin family protein [Paludibacteraceae bacterium]|nr:Hsp20/alpha crystallin family protein [Paludibacteraceae bacterium]HQB68756.1 Hsp20/alpha crystallin family protein [Paludibacteraceae bacterium]HRS68232.1 Hsp20/alpha crystallin family protein [Paludibacteraceae bacterium]